MHAPVFTILILAGYAASLWWLLRRESHRTLLAVTLICGLSLALRVVASGHFPDGLNEDEPKILACTSASLAHDWIFDEGCTGLPVLLNALFQAQLVPLFGPGFWAIRLYSLIASVLAAAGAFAAARALRGEVIPSLAAAAFVAVLPWSIFYGRISIGGELVLHETLLIAALAHLVFQEGAWPEMAVGAFGQWLLLYDYFAGRGILPLAFAAAVLAKGRRRAFCLLVPAIAFAGWMPYLLGHPTNGLGGVLTDLIDTGYATHPLATFATRLDATLHAFVAPVGLDGFLTVRAAAMHPPLVLALAAVGLLTGIRQGLFLSAGLLLGVLPAVISNSVFPSPHRMLMSYVFIAIAAGRAFALVPGRRIRPAVAAAAVTIAAAQSSALYFSSTFWSPKSREMFDAERTAVVDAVPMPPHPKVFVMPQINYFWAPRRQLDANQEQLGAEQLVPPDGPSLYVFSAHAEPLQAFYMALLGPERVRTFGRAFLLTLEDRQWSWVAEHGWSYEAHCGAKTWKTIVPTLFHPGLTFNGLSCPTPVVHVWRGRWDAADADIRLRFSGAATVAAANGPELHGEGNQRSLDFRLRRGTHVTVSVVTSPPRNDLYAALFEITPVSERLPLWEEVTPQ